MEPSPQGTVPLSRTPRRRGLFEPGYEVDVAGHRVASAASAFPGRSLVRTAVLVDLAFVAAVLAQALFGAAPAGRVGGPPWGRFFGRFLMVAGAWIVLAFQAGAMKPRALELRRAIGVIGVGFVLLHLLLSGPFLPHDAPWIAAACLVFGFGTVAMHRALSLRAAEVCEAHPRWESCVPDPHAWTRRRAIIVLSAVEWMAAGAVETWLGNLWFGQVIIAGGVLGLILSKDLSRPRDDHRLVKADRSSNRAWLIYPLAAPVLIPRIVWLLSQARG